MLDAALLASILWAPASFALHGAIHEGTHALAARIEGVKVEGFRPFPSLEGGRFSFAELDTAPVPAAKMPLIAWAPMIIEGIWFPLALFEYLHASDPVLKGILQTEMVSSLVDMFVFALGAFALVPAGNGLYQFNPQADINRPHYPVYGEQLLFAVPLLVGPPAFTLMFVLPTVRF